MGATPAGPALIASLGTTLLYTVAATRSMQYPHTDAGISRYPWVMALQGYELVRGITNEQLGGRERAAGLAGTGLTMLAGWALSPRPRSLRALVAELGWVAGFDMYAARLRRAIGEAADDVSAAMAAHDADILDAAYQRGRRQAEELTAAALAEVRHALDARAPQLPPDLAGEARRRLDQIGPLLPTV